MTPFVFAEFDLSKLSNVDYYAFSLTHFNIQGSRAIGAVAVTTQNSAYLDPANFSSGQKQDATPEISSSVNAVNISQLLESKVNEFSYTNQYGQIGTHNPEEFFARLFRNKYEQDAGPIQIARGLIIE